VWVDKTLLVCVDEFHGNHIECSGENIHKDLEEKHVHGDVNLYIKVISPPPPNNFNWSSCTKCIPFIEW
jgi:hypothetical protein